MNDPILVSLLFFYAILGLGAVIFRLVFKYIPRTETYILTDPDGHEARIKWDATLTREQKNQLVADKVKEMEELYGRPTAPLTEPAKPQANPANPAASAPPP
jgi:hypothetical protein